MTSEARVLANRRNAEKSTGPRTAEGKAVVAQNAVKHGLWARQAVLKDEDAAEFDLHRRRMLDSLAPDGPDQEALAERIVALWWRLKRAERMQDEAIDYLIEADRGDDWVKCRRSGGDPSARVELMFGRAVARDFANARTLDRLTMHERRIESSLYRTMNELRQVQSVRKAEDSDGEGVSRASRPRSEGETPSTRATPCGVTTNEADSAKQSQFAAEEGEHSPPHKIDCAKQSQSEEDVSSLRCEVSCGAGSEPENEPSCETKPMEGVSSLKCQASSGDSALQTSHFTPDTPQATPCGITTNGADSAKQSQSGGVSSSKCEVPSGADRAKQSQSPGSVTGARALPRCVRRVAWHYHNTPRSS
jgi:hypothetical protein